MPRTRCSTETYSSFIVRAASSACISTFARSFEMYTLSISTFPVIRGLSLIACSRRAVSGPVPAPIFANRFGISPCESFTRAKSRCSTSICCWPWCRATFCAASIASRTFVVYLSAFMFSSPSPFHKQEPCQRSETKSRSSKRLSVSRNGILCGYMTQTRKRFRSLSQDAALCITADLPTRCGPQTGDRANRRQCQKCLKQLHTRPRSRRCSPIHVSAWPSALDEVRLLGTGSRLLR